MPTDEVGEEMEDDDDNSGVGCIGCYSLATRALELLDILCCRGEICQAHDTRCLSAPATMPFRQVCDTDLSPNQHEVSCSTHRSCQGPTLRQDQILLYVAGV